jgi:3-oxoadipate enol-lactonase
MRKRRLRAVTCGFFFVLLIAIPCFAQANANISAAQAGASETSARTDAGKGAFVEVDGGKLYYEECGSSTQNVLLIHDGVGNSAVWDDVWPEFCKHYHTIRYDRRGYGKSPETKADYYETDDILAILNRAKVKSTVIVGSSHGGELAIDFTLAHPERVEQLVLVGAVVGGMPPSQHFIDRSIALRAPAAKGDIAGEIVAITHDKYLIAPGNQAAQKKLADLLAASPQDMTHDDRDLPSKPALPRLAEIRVATLILTGDADIADVHANAGAIETGIPRSRRLVISGAGHLMYLEKPAEFTRLVIEFIDGNSGAVSP